MPPDSTAPAGKSELEVQMKFMGDLPAVVGARRLRLRMPMGSRVRDVLAFLSNTYGEAFTSRVFASPTKLHHYILIFVDGEHQAPAKVLDAQLEKGEVDIVMLPMFGGG